MKECAMSEIQKRYKGGGILGDCQQEPASKKREKLIAEKFGEDFLKPVPCKRTVKNRALFKMMKMDFAERRRISPLPEEDTAYLARTPRPGAQLVNVETGEVAMPKTQTAAERKLWQFTRIEEMEEDMRKRKERLKLQAEELAEKAAALSEVIRATARSVTDAHSLEMHSRYRYQGGETRKQIVTLAMRLIKAKLSFAGLSQALKKLEEAELAARKPQGFGLRMEG